MKRYTVLSLFLLCFLACLIGAHADDAVRVLVNGEEVVFDQPPIIENGRTLVPVRAVTEAMEADVAWDPAFGAVLVQRGNQEIKLYIGKHEMYVGTKGAFQSVMQEIKLDTAPAIYNGRTLLPIRAVIEALGGTVYWGETNRTIYVITGYQQLRRLEAPAITWTLYSDGMLVLQGDGKMADYSPSKRPAWYDYRDKVHTVLIENGITNVGDYAFDGFRVLANVSMAPSVRTVGENAFCECPKLCDLLLPEGLLEIRAYAFYRDKGLKTLTFPKTLRTIGEYAFCECTEVRHITFSEGLEVISENAFCQNSSVAVLVFPSTLTQIKTSAFAKCSSLQEATIPSSVEIIGTGVFNACGKLQRIYGIPGTEAERVAKEKRVEFVALNE